MKTEKEVRARIKEFTEAHKDILNCGMATIEINSFRALMQLSATSVLDTLYWVIGEKRPRFKCDDPEKKNT